MEGAYLAQKLFRKRAVGPVNTIVEAVEFCHRHSELVRLIL